MHTTTHTARYRSATRRVLVAVLVAALTLAGCESAQQDEAATGTRPAEASSTEVDDEAFPVTIEHKFGSTEITEEPDRVVTVGLTDHDAFLALGVAPVGVTDWYGEQPHATWPWARDELGGAEPEIVGNAQELDFEKIAALDPDVIVGLYAATDQQTYGRLSQIAPTVAQPDDHVDYGIPWQELTRTAGRIVGQAGQAAQLVSDLEARFRGIREEHPEFVDASAAIATPMQSGGIYVYSSNVANGRLLASLGFELPDQLVEMIGDADGTELSLERVRLLDTDALVRLDAAEGEGPLAKPVYQQLEVHQQGRALFVDSSSEVGGAMSFSSVLSLPFLLDRLVPRLEAAVDGDPATEPTAAPAPAAS